ncbi:hypothetical protein L9F63_019298, partial [Diploptera punctata]
ILGNISNEQKYDYINDGLQIVLHEVNKIQHRNIKNILHCVSILTELKQKLITYKKGLPTLIPAMLEVNNIIKYLTNPLTHGIISSILITADNFVRHFQNHAEWSVKHDIANCHIFYSLFRKVSWTICNNGHDLLISIWLSLGLMGISMLMIILFGFRISSYFKGAHKTHYHWKQRLHAHKWYQTHTMNNDALLFDEDTGKFIGNAVMVPTSTHSLSSASVHTLYNR